jgi:hypothetical protein
VDPVPDPLLLRESGSAGNQTRTSGSVARSSDHQTTEAVGRTILEKLHFSCMQQPSFDKRNKNIILQHPVALHGSAFLIYVFLLRETSVKVDLSSLYCKYIHYMFQPEMDVGEIGCGGVDCISLAQDKDKWRALVNAVMNLWVLSNAEKFLSCCPTGGLSSSAQRYRVIFIMGECILLRM